MANIIVDEEKCVGCGECADVCPGDVFEIENEKAVVANPEECLECESCVETCEQQAITLEID